MPQVPKMLRRHDLQVEESRDGAIDVVDFLEVEELAESSEAFDVVRSEGEWRLIAEPGPFGTGDFRKGGKVSVVVWTRSHGFKSRGNKVFCSINVL